MKYFVGFILGIAFIFFLAFILPESGERVYDCGMAEWHPDIPKEVKEECRNRRYRQWKQDNGKTIT
jgi:hypothetical protein